ncbi:MAG: hypothetical protein ABI884_00900 [Gemmatimonadota bacterium]
MPRTMSRFALSLFAAALLPLSLASCGSDLLNLDQQWALQTVEDTNLPYTVPHASHDPVIISGIADLNSDNTYTMTFTGTVDGVAAQVGEDHGHWSISHSTFTFQRSGGGDYIAALVGSVFRASIPGEIIGSGDPNFDVVFAKQ